MEVESIAMEYATDATPHKNWGGSERMERAALESPIPEMKTDLASGIITPVTTIKKLRTRYRGARLNESDAISCMTHACRAYAKAVGSVLVITDARGKTVFGQVIDPGPTSEPARRHEAYRALADQIPQAFLEEEASNRVPTDPRTRLEFPIYVMPAFPYRGEHGPQVADYGTYRGSYGIPMQRSTDV